VTILLLLFPILLSRLDQSPGQSVLGRLRKVSYYVAYSAGVVAVFLALCVASVPADILAIPFLVATVALLGLQLLLVVQGVAKAVKRRSLVPLNRTTPAWLVAELGRNPRRRSRSELTFSTVRRDGDG
jgi:hypothetical protein